MMIVTLSFAIKRETRMSKETWEGELDNCVSTRCKGTYIRYSRTEEDFCCWDCGSKDYEEEEDE